jgi:hypothetical protein
VHGYSVCRFEAERNEFTRRTSLALMDKSVKRGRGSVTFTVTDCEVLLAERSSAIKVKVVVFAGDIVMHLTKAECFRPLA